MHADDFGGMHYFDGQLTRGGVMLQFGANDVFLSYEQDTNIVVPGSEYRTFDFWLGGAVGAHCVNGNRRSF
jgi:hypothetical protein